MEIIVNAIYKKKNLSNSKSPIACNLQTIDELIYIKLSVHLGARRLLWLHIKNTEIIYTAVI